MKSDKWYERVSPPVQKWMTPRERLAYYLKEYRRVFKKSQASLAKKAGTTQRVISLLEAERYNPSLELMERLARACNMRLDVALRPKQQEGQ
jgi:DNA-binding XRE family transcriptional regulator